MKFNPIDQSFFKNSRFIVFYLIAGIIVTSILFVFYSQKLINRIKHNEYKYIRLFSKIPVIAPKVNDDDLNIFFENVKEGITFPVIISDSLNNPLNYRNIEVPEDSVKAYNMLKKMIKEMDAENKPIKIEIDIGDRKLVQFLHYGESKLIRNLTIYSFLLPFIFFVFIIVALFLFYANKRYEQSFIWVGLAKETAHQLGTPVSSLMGWLEFLKDHNISQLDHDNVIANMNKDIEKLSQISHRFNKIGNPPEFKEIDINKIIKEIVDYFNMRLPNKKFNIKIFFDPGKKLPNVLGNDVLLHWAFENIIKNSIDALKGKNTGFIKIFTFQQNGYIGIDIVDNGIGIEKNNLKKIFLPGYSTKKIGWGLGLSLVKRIIEDYHKGKVFVKESIPGKGTIMTIILRYKNEK